MIEEPDRQRPWIDAVANQPLDRGGDVADHDVARAAIATACARPCPRAPPVTSATSR